MTSRTSAKNQSNVLINLFISKYQQKYGKKPVLNRFRERWGFQDMIDSVGFEDSQRIIEFYFEIPATSHTCKHLFYNFDNMLSNMEAREQDRAERRRIMEQTKQRMKEKNESRD